MGKKSKTKNNTSSKYWKKCTRPLSLPFFPFLSPNYVFAVWRLHINFFLLFKVSQKMIEFFCTVKTKSSGSRPTENQRPRPVWSVTPMCPISISLKGMQPKRLEGCFHFEGNRLNGGWLWKRRLGKNHFTVHAFLETYKWNGGKTLPGAIWWENFLKRA